MLLYDTSNSVIDLVLNHKLKEIKQCKIDAILEVSEDVDVKIKHVELSSLLSNVIDNAIEATSKLDINTRKIIIKLSNQNGMLLFRVTNTVEVDSRKIIFSKSTLKKDKRLHGKGVSIIERIVKKYDGSVLYDYKDSLFTVSILM